MHGTNINTESESCSSTDELQSLTPKCASKQLSSSFTSPPSPSPRQTSLSFSSNNTCPLDYSTDNEVDTSALLLPISPVSPCDDDENDHRSEHSLPEDPCIGPLEDDMQEELQPNTSTIAVLNGNISHMSMSCNNNDANPPPLDMVLDPSDDILNAQVPDEVSTTHMSDCNKKNSNGQSPLSITSSNCFLRGMILLIENGADVGLIDAYGRTPLHLACENTESSNHHDCISYLLKNGADANTQDSFGRSALHISARRGCADCIRTLLDHGAKTDLKDSEGNTALHIAATYGNIEAMEALSPASFEEESSVESVDDQLLCTSDVVRVFHESPREYDTVPSENAWHHQHSARNDLNDSGYFSTKSNGNAWTKGSYYNNQRDNNVPHKIEEERESVEKSSLDSISDSLTVYTNEIECDELRDITWLFSVLHRLLISWLRCLGNLILPKRLQVQTDGVRMAFVEPPDHVQRAMERYKLLSRDRTFKTGSTSKY